MNMFVCILIAAVCVSCIQQIAAERYLGQLDKNPLIAKRIIFEINHNIRNQSHVTPAGVKTTSATKLTPKSVDVRLPLSLSPELYKVELQPDIYGKDPDKFTFNGSVAVAMVCKEPTNNITLHTYKLNYTGNILVYEEGTTNNLYSRHEFDNIRQFVIIHVSKTLRAGARYRLEITQFRGNLANDLKGFYQTHYQRGNKTIYSAVSQMEPTDARKTFPCFDEPAMKAEFDVTLLRKNHVMSLSNMPINRTEDRGDNWSADIYERTPKMSTYLLAFIICDFNYTESSTQRGVKYRALARPEAIDQTLYGLSAGVRVIEHYEDYFNVSFPLPKQDMIALSDFNGGAMENWGLITYREDTMLYEPGVSSEANKQTVATAISHELAHQWFGNLVTMSWWDDIWLNEGFATFVEYLGVDFLHPSWKMFEQFVIEEIQSVFNFDGLISSHPLYVPVSDPDEINEIFDGISYNKNYLQQLKYGNAYHDDLWFALGNASLAQRQSNGYVDVKDIMDTWTLQMNYPTVMVDFNTAGQITLTQRRFLRDRTATDPGKYTSVYDYKWEIPFTYTTSRDNLWNQTSERLAWMHKDGKSVRINDNNRIPEPTGDNWVIGNVLQYGYYRVNYDDRNWNALINQLNTDHTVIHAINRAQIINDAWNLARSGELQMKIALRTTEFLDKERDYVPWKAASIELEYVDSMLKTNSLYGSYQNFVRNKTESVFKAYGLTNTGASHLELYTSSVVADLACKYGVQNCVAGAKKLFYEWMANPSNNGIDPELKPVVYCTAVAEGGGKEFGFILQQYQETNLESERVRLRTALSCSRQVWLLSSVLEMSINSSIIRRQDATKLVIAVARNPVGSLLAWDFVRAHWSFFRENYGAGAFLFPRLIRGVTGSFNTMFQLNELKEFQKSHADLGSATRAFEQSIEKTQSNIQWMETNVHVIREWLASQGY